MDKLQLVKLMVKINDDRDEIAFSNLFDFFAPKLKAYFVQNGLSSDISEELTQDVMSAVWLKSHTYDASKSALPTWIYTIARNKKIDFMRKNSNINIK
jgi:DNA-directed RNA polymerase specialized sigma24 family protein